MITIVKKWIEVKNRKGSGDEEPSDGSSSWKEFWENKFGYGFGQCACRDCDCKATDGSHVIKVGSTDKKSYIVPLCHECNKKTVYETFEVPEEWLMPVSND